MSEIDLLLHFPAELSGCINNIQRLLGPDNHPVPQMVLLHCRTTPPLCLGGFSVCPFFALTSIAPPGTPHSSLASTSATDFSHSPLIITSVFSTPLFAKKDPTVALPASRCCSSWHPTHNQSIMRQP